MSSEHIPERWKVTYAHATIDGDLACVIEELGQAEQQRDYAEELLEHVCHDMLGEMPDMVLDYFKSRGKVEQS